MHDLSILFYETLAPQKRLEAPRKAPCTMADGRNTISLKTNSCVHKAQ
jgi:hypothetical protein